MTQPFRPATAAQCAFIKRLLSEHDVTADPTVVVIVESARDMVMAGTFSTRAASGLIDLLKAQPFQEGSEPKGGEAKPGYYVRGDLAFRVQTNKAGTHTYAMLWSGHSWDYAPGQSRSLADLTPMTGAEAAALGLASGRCIHCCATLGGASLTAKVAALVGYGEICASRNGWPFPKGAAAQRAFVAAATEVAA